MPKDVKAEITFRLRVVRGFNYTPKGEAVERRVDADSQLPQDLSKAQIARLIERGVVEMIRPVKRGATQEVTDG